MRIAAKAANSALDNFVHFQQLRLILLNRIREEEGGLLHPYSSFCAELWVIGDGFPDSVCYHAPFFGAVQRNGIGVLAASSGWIFPQCSSNLRGEALRFGIRGPFLGKHGNVVASVKQNPGRDQTCNTSANDQSRRRCARRLD